MPALYLSKATQSITVDAGYQSVLTVTYTSGAVERYALTDEGAVLDNANWVVSGTDPIWSGDGILVNGLYSINTSVTVDDSQFVFTGPQAAIDSFDIDGLTLDFTTGSVAGAEGSTGLTVTLDGFTSESEAFNPAAFAVSDAGMVSYNNCGKDLFKLNLTVGNTDSFGIDLSDYLMTDETVDSATVTIDDGATIDIVYSDESGVYITATGDDTGRYPAHFSWVTTEGRSSCFDGYIDVREC